MEHDRRRYPRISCNYKAALDLGAAEPCKARIVDLSAEGCLLMFDNPQSIRRGSEMLMAFEVENIPFGVLAQAKSIRSGTSVGVYFPEMTERGRADLLGLIGLMTQFAGKPAASLSLTA
jgi:c-di-GMP-binding flagellar brake protein YcgR